MFYLIHKNVVNQVCRAKFDVIGKCLRVNNRPGFVRT